MTNILWITCDELKVSACSMYGNGQVSLPAAERLAREGVLFERAFVPMPKCIPCRQHMLTGRYVHVDGLRTMSAHNFAGNDFMRLGLEHRSVLHLLKAAGYQTSIAGKQHWLKEEAMSLLDDPPKREGTRPIRYGEAASELMQKAYFGGRVARGL
ncbi:MAG: sulfatase-like hydrolase/transferase [Blastochloris sp.]|nr:sulfatase-like hydrolase/transferase [Blastochloris sp.]